MNHLYLDCRQGARKDTLVGALYGLLGEKGRGAFVARFEGMGMEGVSFQVEETSNQGVPATRFVMLRDGMTEAQARQAASGHEHHSVAEVRQAIAALALDDAVLAEALAIYDILADAEAKAHQTPVADVHFHEVGNAYAIASVVAFCLMVDLLAPGSVHASPIATGYGEIQCAHGRLSVPAPATANVLVGVPCVRGDREGELTTPTGAAMVRGIATDFGDPMSLEDVRSSIGLSASEEPGSTMALLGRGA